MEKQNYREKIKMRRSKGDDRVWEREREGEREGRDTNSERKKERKDR